MRNFYKVLGVASTADDQRIKVAFRRRAKVVHPDLNPGNQRAEARFIELMQAYEVLSDPATRADYDGYLAERRAQSRRRFAHCAGLMMTSFMLTATSAILVMSMAGANVPFRETWRLAVAAVMSPADATAPARAGREDGTAWTAQVAAEEDSPAPPFASGDAAPKAKTDAGASAKAGMKRHGRHLAAPSKAPKGDVVADGGIRQIAPTTRQAAPAVKPAETAPPTSPEEGWWTAPPPVDEPRYGLGASDIR